MNKYFRPVLFATALIFGLSAVSFAAGGSPKIGYIDTNGAAMQSNWGKRVVDDIKREQEKLAADLDNKGKAFKAAKDEYDKKRDVMDEKAKTRKQKELQEMAAELEKAASEASQQFNKDAAEKRGPIGDKIREIVQKIGRDDKYDFILERSAVVFATDKDDITRRVASELDKSAPK